MATRKRRPNAATKARRLIGQIDRAVFELSRMHSAWIERVEDPSVDAVGKSIALIRLASAVLVVTEETTSDVEATKRMAASLEATSPGAGARYLERLTKNRSANVTSVERAWRAVVRWENDSDADAIYQVERIAKQTVETWKHDGEDFNAGERADVFLRYLRMRRAHGEFARATRAPKRGDVESAFAKYTPKKYARRGQVKWIGLVVLLAKACGIRTTNDATHKALKQRKRDTR